MLIRFSHSFVGKKWDDYVWNELSLKGELQVINSDCWNPVLGIVIPHPDIVIYTDTNNIITRIRLN